MYHWSKNDRSHPTAFTYKGLVFPLYDGPDYQRLTQEAGGMLIFAFFGDRALPETEITRLVERMIKAREYVPAEAAA